MTQTEPNTINEAAVASYITDTFTGVETMEAWGYTFYYYGPDRKLPFVTLANSDNEYDRSSNLDRPNVYRVNIGVSKATYRALFGSPPPAPEGAGVVNTGHDFAALNVLMPHPVYASQSWVCILNPSPESFETIKPLIEEAYNLAVQQQSRREARG